MLEKEGIHPHNIQRVAGTSVGSMFALLAATGCSTAYMLGKVPADFGAVVKEHIGVRSEHAGSGDSRFLACKSGPGRS